MTKKGGATKKTDAKLTVKKTAGGKGKAVKDPNKPKRPASAFFVFMEDFRKQYKVENPNVNSVAQVGKAGGVKWKAMSDSDKAPFQAKADKRKKEYEKSIAAYNKKQAVGGKDEEEDEEPEVSDKSKSEVEDEEDDEDSDEE